MSLSINTLISRMKKRVPDAVFKAVDTEFWIDCLMEETLPTYSSYYPAVVKGICVNSAMSIKSIDNQGRVSNCNRYAIPMVESIYPFTGISTFHYPRNFIGGGTYSHNGIVDALTSKVVSATSTVDVRYVGVFEAPNIVIINPAPRIHMDFTVSMYRMRKLEEVNNGLHELFKKLYEADCKIALYYKFFTVSEGGAYSGIEIKDYVASFLEYEEKRTSILEEMDTDYYKSFERVEEAFNYNP